MGVMSKPYGKPGVGEHIECENEPLEDTLPRVLREVIPDSKSKKRTASKKKAARKKATRS
jgi:hypothetical protein